MLFNVTKYHSEPFNKKGVHKEDFDLITNLCYLLKFIYHTDIHFIVTSHSLLTLIQANARGESLFPKSVRESFRTKRFVGLFLESKGTLPKLYKILLE